jgi:hypothetical protein
MEYLIGALVVFLMHEFSAWRNWGGNHKSWTTIFLVKSGLKDDVDDIVDEMTDAVKEVDDKIDDIVDEVTDTVKEVGDKIVHGLDIETELAAFKVVKPKRRVKKKK